MMTLDQLDNLRVASPCAANWDDMTGDDRARHCRACNKTVHDFSGMTREAIAELLNTSEDAICGRLYRRADGTILTEDCPKGLARARQQLRRTAGRIAAALTLLVGGGMVLGKARDASDSIRIANPIKPALKRIRPNAVPQPPIMVMGDICVPSIPPPPATTTVEGESA